MKLQVPASSAFPAVVAAASVLLSLILLPGGGASVRSWGVAPALKLVAGDVVAAVENPVRVANRPQPEAKPTAAPAPAATAAVRVAGPTPVHRHAQHLIRASRPRVAASRQVMNQAAAAPISPVAEHSQGKAKAQGHVRKTASQPKSASDAVQGARVNGAGHAKAHGRPVDVPHGPPAIPPGQEKKGDAGEQSPPGGRGGGK